LTRDELRQRIDTVEESYEFFLAYAARGTTGVGADDEVRQYLQRTDEALTGLARGFADIADKERPQSAKTYHAMIEVLDRDAASAQAAIRVVLAQPAISSQLVDSLNASIHVRALLTDVFLLDEALKETG
jgi:hypothetical protein